MTLFSTEDLAIIRTSFKLNLTINPGEIWAVLGRNGIGKTTMLHTMAGLQPALAGTVNFEGKPLPHYSRQFIAQQIAVLLQQHDDYFPMSVLDTLLTGRYPYASRWNLVDANAMELAQEILTALELSALKHRWVSQLSGGERQRVALATVLMQTPKLYFLDEPTQHLDLHYQIWCLNYLKQRVLNDAAACVMVLHDVNLVSRYCTHVILLQDDGVLLTGPVSELLQQENLEHLYQQKFQSFVTTQGKYWVAM